MPDFNAFIEVVTPILPGFRTGVPSHLFCHINIYQVIKGTPQPLYSTTFGIHANFHTMLYQK